MKLNFTKSYNQTTIRGWICWKNKKFNKRKRLQQLNLSFKKNNKLIYFNLVNSEASRIDWRAQSQDKESGYKTKL